MPDDVPIACSLSEAEMPKRLALMTAIGSDSLLSTERSGQRVELRFALDARERLDDVVAAESRCCAFLDMNVTHRGDALVLTIVAPAGAEPVMTGLAAAFAGNAA